ncbi:hypothetical protein ZWY2020_029855 [Hordeum vulgare]|nr:hypothetical protein ZWY2020_029855 [Hordeum vulgare]
MHTRNQADSWFWPAAPWFRPSTPPTCPSSAAALPRDSLRSRVRLSPRAPALLGCACASHAYSAASARHLAPLLPVPRLRVPAPSWSTRPRATLLRLSRAHAPAASISTAGFLAAPATPVLVSGSASLRPRTPAVSRCCVPPAGWAPQPVAASPLPRVCAGSTTSCGIPFPRQLPLSVGLSLPALPPRPRHAAG